MNHENSLLRIPLNATSGAFLVRKLGQYSINAANTVSPIESGITGTHVAQAGVEMV